MKILSLGAGVQSSTLALLAASGELGEMPDAAIFADTGWEPKKVHEYLDWLESQVPFPVYRVMHKEGLKVDILGNGRFAAVPFFTSSGGMGRRQCTSEYKLIPIRKKTRELLGYAPRKRIPVESCEMWIGISTDEIVRMKPSRDKWITNRWPLIEQRMSRDDCLQWMKTHNYPEPPKSSCLGCPYHSDRQWIEIKNGDQQEWLETVQMDHHIRNRATGMKAEQYMHRQLVPLDQVNFDHLEKQRDIFDGFGNECEGMCGV